MRLLIGSFSKRKEFSSRNCFEIDKYSFIIDTKDLVVSSSACPRRHSYQCSTAIHPPPHEDFPVPSPHPPDASQNPPHSHHHSRMEHPARQYRSTTGLWYFHGDAAAPLVSLYQVPLISIRGGGARIYGLSPREMTEGQFHGGQSSIRREREESRWQGERVQVWVVKLGLFLLMLTRRPKPHQARWLSYFVITNNYFLVYLTKPDGCLKSPWAILHGYWTNASVGREE